jgi:hypothetical protein
MKRLSPEPLSRISNTPKPRSFNFRQLSSVSRVAISPASMADTRYS